MNKTKISKIVILLLVIFALALCTSTRVWADDIIDLTNSLTGPTATPTPTPTPTATPTPEATPTPTPTPANPNTNTNTSTYEESDIPYAGPAETILMGTAFVVFAIIGIYTYIKLSDYSNI